MRGSAPGHGQRFRFAVVMLNASFTKPRCSRQARPPRLLLNALYTAGVREARPPYRPRLPRPRLRRVLATTEARAPAHGSTSSPRAGTPARSAHGEPVEPCKERRRSVPFVILSEAKNLGRWGGPSGVVDTSQVQANGQRRLPRPRLPRPRLGRVLATTEASAPAHGSTSSPRAGVAARTRRTPRSSS